MTAPAPRIDQHQCSDGYQCAVRVWNVDNPVGQVVLLHGIVSHGGWYLSSCQHLAGAGFEVHAIDRRGSGLNMQQRGDVDRYETWLNDVEGYLESLPSNIPKLLLGISWGGKLVAAIARHRPDAADAIGMICPGLFAKQFPSPVKYAGLSSAKLAGWGSFRVTIPLQDPALFTDEPKWQDYIKNDPLTLREVTIRFALADRELTDYVTQSPEEISPPALLMLAGRDRIVDNQRSREFFHGINCAGKKLIEYADAAHTLEFESDPLRYYEDLSRWLRDVVANLTNRSS